MEPRKRKASSYSKLVCSALVEPLVRSAQTSHVSNLMEMAPPTLGGMVQCRHYPPPRLEPEALSWRSRGGGFSWSVAVVISRVRALRSLLPSTVMVIRTVGVRTSKPGYRDSSGNSKAYLKPARELQDQFRIEKWEFVKSQGHPI